MDMDVQIVTRHQNEKVCASEIVAVVDGSKDYAESLIPGLERARIAAAVQKWRQVNNVDPVPSEFTLVGEFSYQVETQSVIHRH